MRILTAVVLASTFVCTSALAAEPVAQIEAFSGKVLVNQGKGFVAASQGLTLNAGDRILVGKDGAAKLNYIASNCSVDVASATVVAVKPQAPCAEGQTVAAVDSVFINAAQGSDAAFAAGGGSQFVALVAPAFIVGAGAVFTYSITQENNQEPVSQP